jgi:hypothetical protein
MQQAYGSIYGTVMQQVLLARNPKPDEIHLGH